MRILLAALLLASFSLFAQSLNISVGNNTMLIDGVSTSVQTATVSGDIDDFKRIYKRFLKKNFDVKTNGRDNKLVSEEVVINQITDKRGDLILFAYPLPNEVSFNLAYKLGYDVYLNPQEFPEESERLQEFARFFLFHYYYQYLQTYIKQEKR